MSVTTWVEEGVLIRVKDFLKRLKTADLDRLKTASATHLNDNPGRSTLFGRIELTESVSTADIAKAVYTLVKKQVKRLDENEYEIPARDELADLLNHLLIGPSGWKWGYVSPITGEWKIPPQFAAASSFEHGFASVKRGELWGLINADNKWIIEPQFREEDFWDARSQEILCIGFEDGRLGLVSSSGVLLQTSCEEVESFEGDILRIKKDGKWGYVDSHGNWVVPPTYDELRTFSDGKAYARLGNRWGIIDTAGTWIIEPRYAAIEHVEGTDGPVKGESGLWGYAKADGEWIFAPQFEECIAVDAERFAFKKAGLWGIADTSGRIRLDAAFQSLTKRLGDIPLGLYPWPLHFKLGESHYFIDRSGRLVGNRGFDDEKDPYSREAADWSAWVCQDGLWGLLEGSGQWLLEPKFHEIRNASEGAIVRFEDAWGVVSKGGEVIIQPTYGCISEVGNGVFKMKDGEQWGLISHTGDILLSPVADEIDGYLGSGPLVARQGELWGLISQRGEWVCEPIFQSKPEFWARIGIVFNGRIGFIDEIGRWLVPPTFVVTQEVYSEVGWRLLFDSASGLINVPVPLPAVLDGLPKIETVQPFARLEEALGGDDKPNEPYLVFNVDRCFERIATAEGRALREYLGCDNIEPCQWVFTTY